MKNVNMALVPKNDDEILCFEFECEADGEQYFVFINADTLEETDIFKVIKGTEGYTVMLRDGAAAPSFSASAAKAVEICRINVYKKRFYGIIV